MSRPRLIALLLALITLVVYLPVSQHDFLDYDDDVYVTQNPAIQHGFTWAAIKWAFTTGYASNWHPLTWLSHMLDCELFGLNAGAHHLDNVVFHAANAVLLFVLLWRMTSFRADASARQAGTFWPSAFVAALFAWHPLHVESVAWVSERKDVLSTFFALLALLSYTKYAKENSRRDFWIALVFFALGLMSKPMLVTLPFVMLLLDFWPLNRVEGFRLKVAGSKIIQPSTFNLQLVIEKWPFFLLAAISCVVTFLAQRAEAVVALDRVPLGLRFENVPVAYVRYLSKTVWPVNLAVIYPLPKQWPWPGVAAATAVLIFLSVMAWRGRRQSPWLLVGWLWFLGTLVPVIGLVQVGAQALADRYTYVPLIGIFIAVAFQVGKWVEQFQIPKTAASIAAIAVLTACITGTQHQLRYWEDSRSLFTHALAVTKDNFTAQLDLGVALAEEGKPDEALSHYRETLRLYPELYQADINIGDLLDDMGKPSEALIYCRKAVELNPNRAPLHNTLGIVLAELGRFNEAANEFNTAARLDPTYPWAHFEMGKALLKQGRDAGAIDRFREALRLDPENFQILTYIAHVLAAEENPGIRDGKTALILAAKANALTGGRQPLVLDAFGMACAETGDFTNAIELTQKAFDIATAAKMKNLEPMKQRLQLYKNRQPWRESFLSTNAPPGNPPAN